MACQLRKNSTSSKSSKSTQTDWESQTRLRVWPRAASRSAELSTSSIPNARVGSLNRESDAWLLPDQCTRTGMPRAMYL